jgi:hypothetical protein
MAGTNRKERQDDLQFYQHHGEHLRPGQKILTGDDRGIAAWMRAQDPSHSGLFFVNLKTEYISLRGKLKTEPHLGVGDIRFPVVAGHNASEVLRQFAHFNHEALEPADNPVKMLTILGLRKDHMVGDYQVGVLESDGDLFIALTRSLERLMADEWRTNNPFIKITGAHDQFMALSALGFADNLTHQSDGRLKPQPKTLMELLAS